LHPDDLNALDESLLETPVETQNSKCAAGRDCLIDPLMIY